MAEHACQCGRPDCEARVEVADADWERHHRIEGTAIVAPWHVEGDSRIVVKTPAYWVLRRERSLDETVEESFPASDPPAGPGII